MYTTIFARLSYFLGDFKWYLLLAFASVVIFFIFIFKFRKKRLLLICSTLLFLILAFIAAEAYFRYAYDVPDGLGFLKVSKKWTERHVVYNNYFYRDKDFELTKKEGTKRIGILGDSIVWGGGIENQEERFSNVLEKKLKAAGQNVEVLNLGRPGYDTQQETEEFEKVRHLNFDILVWVYFINDIQPNIKSTGTRIIETNRDLPLTITFFTNKSYFLDFIYWRLTPKHRKTFKELRAADIAQYENKELLALHKERIANFIKSFEGSDTKILVVMFPSLLLLGQDYPAQHVHQIMQETFEKNNVEVLDLFGDFVIYDKEKLMASKFDPHPNELAHLLVADRLLAVLTIF